ncbi:MAG TPA: 4-(cytidine 5'-diphospho)-2-C-methyl-D-erythritol kinase [Acidimicrobiales bacterium]|nr:4-(cytidine 5'-diphospho)-2-C-methyl-D-erythritol kinase [Acidimicrobiales bacterium]
MAEVLAPAKLTVNLRITGRRRDGYHFLEAEMMSLDLHDLLVITDGDGLEIVGPAAAGVPVDDTNLIRRALAAVGRTAHVHVDKRVPAGAGLGGGSSDAAAVLRWAGVSDIAVAASLGADVPFCLIGGRARVTRVGDVIEPLTPMRRMFTLVMPPFGMSTVDVYRAWDELGGPAGEHGNDLEPAAIVVDARLLEWRQRVETATGMRPTLAGSGSTWFVDGDHAYAAATLAPARVVVASTLS